MKRPRGLSPEEAAAWRQVASTVTPLVPPPPGEGDRREAGVEGHARDHPTLQERAGLGAPSRGQATPPVPLHHASHGPLPRSGEELDSSWNRRLARGLVEPDFTLDLHGHGLDAAYQRLDRGLAQASALGARVVLLVTGRPRPVDPADRGTRRGAIRAKVGDWIAAGPHAADIATIRPAHRRHGGAGALYLILRRRR